jgi:hypothetical protein
MKIATPLLAAAGIALVLAGCGSNKNNNTPAASASSNSFVAELYKHSACMRSHGVTNFPDPHVKISPGKTAVRAILPASVANSPRFKAAQEACKGFEPGPQNGSPGESAGQREERAHAMLAFAQCLRAHGVAGFPDPSAQGQLSFAMIKKAGVDLQAPSLLPAAKACVGVTRGQITFAQVQEAIRHSTEPQSSGGEEGGSESGHAGGGN